MPNLLEQQIKAEKRAKARLQRENADRLARRAADLHKRRIAGKIEREESKLIGDALRAMHDDMTPQEVATVSGVLTRYMASPDFDEPKNWAVLYRRWLTKPVAEPAPVRPVADYVAAAEPDRMKDVAAE